MPEKVCKIIWVIMIALAGMGILGGMPSVAYWGLVVSNWNSYQIADFQIENTSLSGMRRGFVRFWQAKGKVGLSYEMMTMRYSVQRNFCPFKIGKTISVYFNSHASTVLVGGRNLRVLTINDFLAAKQNLAACLILFFGPAVLVCLLYIFFRPNLNFS